MFLYHATIQKPTAVTHVFKAHILSPPPSEEEIGSAFAPTPAAGAGSDLVVVKSNQIEVHRITEEGFEQGQVFDISDRIKICAPVRRPAVGEDLLFVVTA